MAACLSRLSALKVAREWWPVVSVASPDDVSWTNVVVDHVELEVRNRDLIRMKMKGLPLELIYLMFNKAGLVVPGSTVGELTGRPSPGFEVTLGDSRLQVF